MSPKAATSLHGSAPIESGRSNDRISDRSSDRVSERTGERRLERPVHGRLTDDGRFSIDMNRVPKGYIMEWKRHSIMGMEDKRNQVIIRQYHWEPVPHKVQPHILGHLCKDEGQHIVVDGQGLYMRPEYLNKDANKEQVEETNAVLSEQLQALRLQSKDQVGSRNTYIKKSTVAVPQQIDE